MNEAQRIAALTAALPRLNTGSQAFAQSLLSQYARRGSLSVRQWPHVDSLIQRAAGGGSPAAQGFDLPEGVSVLAERFAAAAAHGQRAAVTVPMGGSTYRIASPSATSSYAGRPVMFVRRDNAYVGRIESGRFMPGREAGPSAATLAALRTLFVDPLANMVRIGRQTGTCCFCNRELTDPRSVQHGYGPICAGYYGLPWDADRDGLVDGIAAQQASINRAHRADEPRPRSARPARPHAVSNAAPVAPDQLDDEDREFMGDM